MTDQPTCPGQQYRWVRRILPRTLQPWLRGLRKSLERHFLELDEPYRTVYPYTQVSQARQHHIVELCRIIERESIPGAVVECGVLDGGMAALMAHATRVSSRPIHLFDAWRGLPEPVAQDGVGSWRWSGQVVGSPTRVRQIMGQLKIERSRVHFHQGWFHETFPHVSIDQIALLHIDCDFYEPTRLCLQRWYSMIASGGYIQFDDYSAFAGCKCAVDEFLAEHSQLALQHQDVPGGAWFVRKVPPTR